MCGRLSAEADEDLTAVDLWLYERPTVTTRRVQICDMLGALLDYAGVDRERFANAWKASAATDEKVHGVRSAGIPQAENPEPNFFVDK
jgi:hypothetical protein